jgi:hypothetical protein
MRDLRMVVTLLGVWLVGAGVASAEPESTVWLGGGLGLSPSGTLEGEVPAAGVKLSADTATAIGISGIIEARVTPNVSIGFAPNLIFNVKPTNDNESATEIDLPLRLAVGGDVAPSVRLYGFASPGYSILFLPEQRMSSVDLGDPSGFMIGFGGGAGFHVAPNVMVTGELGYQFRFLSTTPRGVDVTFKSNYLTLALGVVAGI